MANHYSTGASDNDDSWRSQRPPSYIPIGAAQGDGDGGVRPVSCSKPWARLPSYSSEDDDLEAGVFTLTPSSVASEDIASPIPVMRLPSSALSIDPLPATQTAQDINLAKFRCCGTSAAKPVPLVTPPPPPPSSSSNRDTSTTSDQDNTHEQQTQQRPTVSCCMDSLPCAIMYVCEIMAAGGALILTKDSTGWGCSHPELARFVVFLGISAFGFAMHASAAAPAEALLRRSHKIIFNCLLPFITAAACLGAVNGWSRLCPVPGGAVSSPS